MCSFVFVVVHVVVLVVALYSRSCEKLRGKVALRYTAAMHSCVSKKERMLVARHIRSNEGLHTSRLSPRQHSSLKARTKLRTSTYEYSIRQNNHKTPTLLFLVSSLTEFGRAPHALTPLHPHPQPQPHPQVRSIECKRQSVKEVSEGQSATFAVRSVNRRVALRRSTFRKGMVAIDGQDDPKAAREFEADVVILHHSTTVAPGYQPVIHCGVVRQAAAILSMSGTESGMEALRTGQTATVRFRFMVRGGGVGVGSPRVTGVEGVGYGGLAEECGVCSEDVLQRAAAAVCCRCVCLRIGLGKHAHLM